MCIYLIPFNKISCLFDKHEKKQNNNIYFKEIFQPHYQLIEHLQMKNLLNYLNSIVIDIKKWIKNKYFPLYLLKQTPQIDKNGDIPNQWKQEKFHEKEEKLI